MRRCRYGCFCNAVSWVSIFRRMATECNHLRNGCGHNLVRCCDGDWFVVENSGERLRWDYEDYCDNPSHSVGSCINRLCYWMVSDCSNAGFRLRRWCHVHDYLCDYLLYDRGLTDWVRILDVYRLAGFLFDLVAFESGWSAGLCLAGFHHIRFVGNV